MQPLTGTAAPASPGPKATRGRWIWTLSGVTTVAFLTVLGTALATKSGNPPDGQNMSAVPTRTVAITQPVTSMSVASYGAPIRVAVGPVGQVTVVEAISFDEKSGPPSVTAKVTDGALTLAAPSCLNSDCSVGFTVTVPASVAVTASSEGGEIHVSGATTADLDSGGAPVTADAIQQALSVTSEGGSITVTGAGSADLDSGGGPIAARGVGGTITADADGGSIEVHGAATASLDSGGGPVTVTGVSGHVTATANGGSIFVIGSTGANLDTGGGPAEVDVLNGPLTANTDGGELRVNRLTGPLSADTGDGPVIADGLTSPTCRVTTDGGSAEVDFNSAPQSVQVSTGGGPAFVGLPGGPYAVTAESFGGPEQVTVGTSPSAASTVAVSTDGGQLQIMPSDNGAPVQWTSS
jgi:hypothetical protein